MGIIIICCFYAFPTPNFGKTKATILEPVPGAWIAASDMGFYNFHDYTDAVLQKHSHQVKKLLDLSTLNESTWKRIQAAEVSIFMHAEDGCGDGLDESFEIIVNGHVNTFPTKGLVHSGLGWFDHYMNSHWFDFPLTKEQLVRGTNEILVRKVRGTEVDDRLKVGIDIFEDWGNSRASFDGGKTWSSGPLNRPLQRVGYPHYGHRGELMVRLNLYEHTRYLTHRPFSHDDLPPLPAIDLNPPIKPLPTPDTQPTTYRQGDREDIFENGWMRLHVAHADGLELRRFVHKPMDADILTTDRNSFFILDIDGRLISSQDLPVQRREEPLTDSDRYEVTYHLRDNISSLEVGLSLCLGTDQELSARLYLKNASEETRLVKAAFPLLAGIGWSADFADDYYMFPYGAGAISNHPTKFLSPYGGGTGSGGSWMQVMASYSPSAGGGVYIRPNDPSGGYKVLHLTRAGENGADPAFAFQGLIFNMLNGQATAGYAMLEPLPKVAGTSMAISYMQRELQPNQRWILPTSVVGVMNGGWQVAMDAYRRWFESWCHKRPWPGKLVDKFNMSGDSFAHLYRTEEGYHTDVNRWGYQPINLPDYFSRPPDIIDITSWWEWDEVTEAYMQEMQKEADKAGLKFQLWPGRHAEIEGKHYNWGNQGAYGLQGYNERWGGLPALRKWINDMKAQDYAVVLYINEGEACLSSNIGKRYGPDWNIMWPEGNYFWPFFMWEMCVDNPLWRQHLADTCRRIVAETGSDGVFIDEFGGAARICMNPNHEHTFAERPGDYVVFQGQAEASRLIRKAVDQVDPEAVLLTESTGIDVMWQYLDGCGDYDLSANPMTGARAKNWEGFVGINIARYYFPRHKHFDYEFQERHPEWRFFNATGAFNREWFYKAPDLAILKENAHAIGTLAPEPMIPTLMRRVYVNAFPGENKTIYMVYNARNESVAGDLMEIDHADGRHMIDLKRCRDVDVKVKGSAAVVSIDLPPRSVTCLAYLPGIVAVQNNGRDLQIQVADGWGVTNGKVVNVHGDVLAYFEMTDGKAQVKTTTGEARDPDQLVKVYRGPRLVDAVELNESY